MESDSRMVGAVKAGLDVLERLASPRLVRPWSPTADLYLLNACGDWVGAGGPIERLAPGVFASAHALLVVRHAGGAMALPERRRVIWLIDDDVDAALSCRDIPLGQRAKLWLFEHRHGQRLRASGCDVVVSSDALKHRYPEAAVLRPFWAGAPAGIDHHREEGPIRIGFLGSAVHRGDLGMVRPLLEELLVRDDVELHIAANHHLGRLAGHPRLRPIEATSWPDWKRWIAETRLHIALYPLADNPVNRARSCNKIIEHAIVGAASVYSANWPEAARIARRGAGLVLENDLGRWEAALDRLIRERDLRLRLAAAGRSLANDLNHPGQQRAFWKHAFSLSPTDTT